jgi:nickel-type superoxide dismutase maturation protease
MPAMSGAQPGVPPGPGRVGFAVVRGRSMLPTLRPGDRLLVRYGARPVVGKVAVVRLPDSVVAVKRLSLHDADGWWVSRDNPVEGVDSWSVGAIPPGDVLGTVVVRVWPRPGRIPAPPGVSGPPHSPGLP